MNSKTEWSEFYNYVMDLPFNAEIKFPSLLPFKTWKEWNDMLVSNRIAQRTMDPKTGKWVLTKL